MEPDAGAGSPPGAGSAGRSGLGTAGPEEAGGVLATPESLARLHAAIERDGHTPELILRRGMLHLAVGDALRAALDAAWTVRRRPRWAEAHYLKGRALLAMADARLGWAERGRAPDRMLPSLEDALNLAGEAFSTVLRLNPADEEAAQRLRLVRALCIVRRA